jgi:hypothetical protein
LYEFCEVVLLALMERLLLGDMNKPDKNNSFYSGRIQGPRTAPDSTVGVVINAWRSVFRFVVNEMTTQRYVFYRSGDSNRTSSTAPTVTSRHGEGASSRDMFDYEIPDNIQEEPRNIYVVHENVGESPNSHAADSSVNVRSSSNQFKYVPQEDLNQIESDSLQLAASSDDMDYNRNSDMKGSSDDNHAIIALPSTGDDGLMMLNSRGLRNVISRKGSNNMNHGSGSQMGHGEHNEVSGFSIINDPKLDNLAGPAISARRAFERVDPSNVQEDGVIELV